MKICSFSIFCSNFVFKNIYLMIAFIIAVINIIIRIYFPIITYFSIFLFATIYIFGILGIFLNLYKKFGFSQILFLIISTSTISLSIYYFINYNIIMDDLIRDFYINSIEKNNMMVIMSLSVYFILLTNKLVSKTIDYGIVNNQQNPYEFLSLPLDDKNWISYKKYIFIIICYLGIFSCLNISFTLLLFTLAWFLFVLFLPVKNVSKSKYIILGIIKTIVFIGILLQGEFIEFVRDLKF